MFDETLPPLDLDDVLSTCSALLDMDSCSDMTSSHGLTPPCSTSHYVNSSDESTYYSDVSSPCSSDVTSPDIKPTLTLLGEAIPPRAVVTTSSVRHAQSVERSPPSYSEHMAATRFHTQVKMETPEMQTCTHAQQDPNYGHDAIVQYGKELTMNGTGECFIRRSRHGY